MKVAPEIKIRPFQPGEASYSAYLQMRHYERVYNFSGVFELYMLTSMVKFLSEPAGGELWVALDQDKIIGTIAIFKTEEHTAQLRWFVVDDSYQGMGVGKRLMDTAMDFCRQQKYRHVFLWTINILDAARHLYAHYGFSPTEEKANTEWTGERLMEERWDLEITY